MLLLLWQIICDRKVRKRTQLTSFFIISQSLLLLVFSFHFFSPWNWHVSWIQFTPTVLAIYLLCSNHYLVVSKYYLLPWSHFLMSACHVCLFIYIIFHGLSPYQRHVFICSFLLSIRPWHIQCLSITIELYNGLLV